MGGERASTTRRRERGEICANCRRVLDPPDRRGERYCDACGPRHRVYLHFHLYRGWVCTFLEPDLTTSIGPIRILKDDTLLRATITRGGAIPDEDAIAWGRGSVYLSLTERQYRRLAS